MRPSFPRLGLLIRSLQASLLVIGLGVAGAFAAPLFPNPAYPTGPNPYGLAMGDFNGDGRQDLIVSNFGYLYEDPGSLSLFLGNPDGTFAGEVRIPTSFKPARILTGNFNGDNLPDLVIWSNVSGAALLLGRNGGNFAQETPIPMDLSPEWIYLGDFNGDGRDDLLAFGGSSSGVAIQVLFGSTSGNFTAAPPFAPGDLQTQAVADVDGDGKTDLLVVTANFTGPNEIRVLGGNGDGTFRLLFTLATGNFVFNLFPADFNGDGRTDFGAGTYTQGPNGLTLGPFLLFYGTGGGAFEPGSSDGTPHAVFDLATGDFNRDGWADFAEVSDFDSILVRLGTADGTFLSLPAFYAGASDYRILSHDFDRNGTADLAVLANWSEAVLTFSGNGDGTFGPPPIEPLRNALGSAAALADFNGDGKLDLAAGDVTTDGLSVLLGNGDGTFGAATLFPAGVSPSAVAAGDFNHDGRQDLAVAAVNWHDFPPDPMPPGSFSILMGNGDGTFQPPISYETGVQPSAISLGDFNGDGTVDLLVLNGMGGYGLTSLASLFLGNGDGTFTPSTPVAVGAFASEIAVGDFNRDGHPDLAVSSRGHYSNDYPYAHLDGGVSILAGNGDGTFQPGVLLASIFSASSLTDDDLNGDGILDLAVADEGTLVPDGRGGVIVLLGKGNGTFLPGSTFTAGVGPLDVNIGDFDGDGIKDLALANNGGDESILLGRGGGAFAPEVRFGLFGSPIFLADADLNGDGSLDLLVLSSGGAFVLAGRAPAAGTRVFDLALTMPGPRQKRSGLLNWRTDREVNLAGFNVVLVDSVGHRVTLNPEPIACLECDTGLGHSYAYQIPNILSGRNVFLETVYRDGTVIPFGPATILGRHGRSPVGPVSKPGASGEPGPGRPNSPGGRGSPVR